MWLWIVFIFIVAIIAYIIWQKKELKKFTVSVFEIPVDCDDNCGNSDMISKFVVISDLHNQVYGKNNRLLLNKIDEIQPEFIVIAGDMMIAKPGYSLDVALEFIKAIAEKYKVYYGIGNHEYRLKIYPERYPGMYEQFINEIKKSDVVLLENKSVVFEKNDVKINITGLEIERQYYKRIKNIKMPEGYIESLIGEKTNIYTILVAHNPEYFDDYAEWGANLVLSGHIHGGMVRLPYLGGVISPKVRLFPEYDAGLFEKNGSYMILSRGLGMHTIPVRINNRAELVEVHLKRKG